MKFTKCYTVILTEHRISADARFLYTVLKSYTSEKDNRAWPSIPTLCRTTKWGERKIRYCLAELKRWEVVQWNTGYTGKSNTYFLTDQISAGKIAKGWYPVLPPDPLPELPPNYTHIDGDQSFREEERA